MKSIKTVQIIARFAFKGTNKVVYKVRASNGIDAYETSMCDGKSVGCTCPAKVRCYHMKDLETIEANRQPVVVEVAPVVEVVATPLYELTVEQLEALRKEGTAKQKLLKKEYRRWYNSRVAELKVDQLLNAA